MMWKFIFIILLLASLLNLISSNQKSHHTSLLNLISSNQKSHHNCVNAESKPKPKGKIRRTQSEQDGHKNCENIHFVPKNENASEPSQVHLSLTNRPGEMTITWVTFHDEKYGKPGVQTYVDYWEYENLQTVKSLLASRIRHEYSDTIEIKCSKENKPKNWNKLQANIRYIHSVTLTGLKDNQQYQYRVGHCRPIPPTEPNCSCVPETSGCVKQKRDRVFNFHAFPWHRNENNLEPFTVAVFGDLGLKKPDDLHVMDEERHSDESQTFDTLAPQSMEALMELVHREKDSALHHPMMKPENVVGKQEKEIHPILKSHLNVNSSGLEMKNVQLILHIGDIAYDLHEWRLRKNKRGEPPYNLGDRFMNIVEDVAAYVPYMVIAGNHENEEKKAERPDPPGAEAHFDPQYEHFESRFNMPKNYHGHDTNQFYHFTYGPIWFLSISTEFYYSYSKKEPVFHWIPDVDRVREQYDFIEYSLIKANLNRDKYPWIVVVQHRPFYCTSKNPITCNFNKFHKDGIPDPDDPDKLIYGLEALFNRYHVDLVITGHEHTYELFPPIQLHKQHNKVIPYKYWWHAKRNQSHGGLEIGHEKSRIVAQEKLHGDGLIKPLKRDIANGTSTKTIQHEFMAYMDPIAPTYVIVGRPGNDEDMEQLTVISHYQRIKQYNQFSLTLLHFPGERAKRSFLAVRQVGLNGYVPLEFALEKTFAHYDREIICDAIYDKKLDAVKSKFLLERSDIIQDRVPFTASEQFLRKKVLDTQEFSIFWRNSNGAINQNKGKFINVSREKVEENPYSSSELQEKTSQLKQMRPERKEAFDKEEMELELLQRETKPEASVNSKIRALLHAFNRVKMEGPNDMGGHAVQLFTIAKENVCKTGNLRREISARHNVSEYAKLRKNLINNARVKNLMKRFNEGNDEIIEETYNLDKKGTNDRPKHPPEIPIRADKKNLDEKTNSNNYNPYRQAEVKVKVNGNHIAHGFLENEKIYGNYNKMGNDSDHDQQNMHAQVRIKQKPTVKAINWGRQELRALANSLAFHYMVALERGYCQRDGKLQFRLFRHDKNDPRDLYSKQEKYYLDDVEVKKLLSTKNSASNCFSVVLKSLPGKKDYKTVKGQKNYYESLMYQLLHNRSLELAISEKGDNGRYETASAATILEKIQANSLDTTNFYKNSAKRIVVDDPNLIRGLKFVYGMFSKNLKSISD